MPAKKSAHENLKSLSRGDAPVLETVAEMTVNTYAHSGLDEQTYALVRVAALVAMDAAPVSYLLNLGAAEEIGVPIEKIEGTLVAIAPVVGSARVASAAGRSCVSSASRPKWKRRLASGRCRPRASR